MPQIEYRTPRQGKRSLFLRYSHVSTSGAILLLFTWLSICPTSLSGQQTYISKYVSGQSGKAEDRAHRIELFNESRTLSQDLSGYMLMTRNYVFQFPDQTILRPLQSLRLGYDATGGKLDLAYARLETWKKREPIGSQNGDFTILYDQTGEIVDAFYFSLLETVDFLPTSLTWKTSDGSDMFLEAPREDDPIWVHLKASQDPAFSFFRIAGRWQVGSRNKNILPAVKYRTPKISYEGSSVLLSWTTQEERDCFFHLIERSTDGKNFKEIGIVESIGSSSQEQTYSYTDTEIEQDRLYYYRIANSDKFGNVVYATPVKIRSEEGLGLFALEILEGDPSTNHALNLRFSGKEQQQIRIQLMDEELREISVLYYGIIEANKQNLIIYKDPLPLGKYFVIVSTEAKRYYEPFIIE